MIFKWNFGQRKIYFIFPSPFPYRIRLCMKQQKIVSEMWLFDIRSKASYSSKCKLIRSKISEKFATQCVHKLCGWNGRQTSHQRRHRNDDVARNVQRQRRFSFGIHKGCYYHYTWIVAGTFCVYFPYYQSDAFLFPSSTNHSEEKNANVILANDSKRVSLAFLNYLW